MQDHIHRQPAGLVRSAGLTQRVRARKELRIAAPV